MSPVSAFLSLMPATRPMNSEPNLHPISHPPHHGSSPAPYSGHSPFEHRSQGGKPDPTGYDHGSRCNLFRIDIDQLAAVNGAIEMRSTGRSLVAPPPTERLAAVRRCVSGMVPAAKRPQQALLCHRPRQTRAFRAVGTARRRSARSEPHGRCQGSAHSLVQRWLNALHEHPDRPDGIEYRYRHNSDELAVRRMH